MFEEKQLVRRFNQGDADALREIYELYKVDLVTLAAALLADKADAEDMVHDVFVKFLGSAGAFRLTGSLKSFLATCVANRARTRNRRDRRQVDEDGHAARLVAPVREQPDFAAVFGEDCRHLGRALAALPYDQREVVLLHLKGGLKFREIAQHQAVSINTVQGRYRYGLDKLRALLHRKESPCNQTMTSAR